MEVDRAVDTALSYPEPSRRPLRIFAFDPMVARLSGTDTCILSVPYEPLPPGPDGELLQIVDYDGTYSCYYEPVALDDPRVLLQEGLAPSERDPRFHQQMVYAVTSALLENFELSLGRRFRWRGAARLRIFPHAFQGRNAKFVPGSAGGPGSLQFGYFRADDRNPGPNLPGQHVFSCLSHDIVVHEATHALVHRLRPRFADATNKDVFAFHEAFADLVALFQHFTLPELVERSIASTRAQLTEPSPLVELARQFGEGSGMGRSLRDAIGEAPDPTSIAAVFEPHARGAILVAAVFDGFFSTYQNAIGDLVRIATAGTGLLPPGALQPDLVRRIANEARRTASRFMHMCIRAFQYLPVVDPTFGDFLRSIVTADREAYPLDESGARAALVEGFRKRGIYPGGTTSLVDEALSWPDADSRGLPPLPPLPSDVINTLVRYTAMCFRPERGLYAGAAIPPLLRDSVARKLNGYARANMVALDLAPEVPVQVDGFNASFGVGAGGEIRVDVGARFLQTAPKAVRDKFRRRLGGMALRGGTTVVADATGEVRHVVSKRLPLPVAGSVGEAGARRWQDVLSFADEFDSFSGPWVGGEDRIADTLSFASVDGDLDA